MRIVFFILLVPILRRQLPDSCEIFFVSIDGLRQYFEALEALAFILGEVTSVKSCH